MVTKTKWFVEITDTFGDEANYSWVRRYLVYATTERGAMRIIGREYGGEWRNDGYQWIMKDACICAFVDEYDEMINGAGLTLLVFGTPN